MRLYLLLLMALAAVALAAVAQEAPKKIDPAYMTAVVAISSQLQQQVRVMQEQASAAIAKIEEAQCKESKITRANCTVDWRNGIYFYSKPVPPPGTASPAK